MNVTTLTFIFPSSGVPRATADTVIPLAAGAAAALGAFTILGTIKSNSENRKLSDFFVMDFCECM